MNWQEQLQAFKDANPELPEGTECTSESPNTSGNGTCPRLDISIERKGRAGKTATLITGWNVSDERLREIASVLKQKLGTGGSARGGDILIQGDRREDVMAQLLSMGFKARII